MQCIKSISEDRCSLSEEDLKILNETMILLRNLKKKKGKTNKQILEAVVKVVVSITKFFR